MPIVLVISAFGGFLCGFLNTVASSGSAVTLPLLVFMGLTPIVANATNRVPVVVAALIATITFLRAKVIDRKPVKYTGAISPTHELAHRFVGRICRLEIPKKGIACQYGVAQGK